MTNIYQVEQTSRSEREKERRKRSMKFVRHSIIILIVVQKRLINEGKRFYLGRYIINRCCLPIMQLMCIITYDNTTNKHNTRWKEKLSTIGRTYVATKTIKFAHLVSALKDNQLHELREKHYE